MKEKRTMLIKLSRVCFALMLTLGFGLSALAQSQNDQMARTYYFEAERAVSMEAYDDALAAITKAEQLLGEAKAATTAMKVKIYYGQGHYQKAKGALDTFYTFSAGDNLAREMAPYLTRIDNKIEERNARIAAKNNGRADKGAKPLVDDRAVHNDFMARCRKDDLWACFKLGYRYHLGKPPASDINHKEAAIYYALSCNPQKYTLGCNNLGGLYGGKYIATGVRMFKGGFKGGVYDQPLYDRYLASVRSESGLHEAFVLYKIACDHGNMESQNYGCWNLGKLYESGVWNKCQKVIVTEPNTFAARVAYKKACKAGRDAACEAERNLKPDVRERQEKARVEADQLAALKAKADKEAKILTDD